MRSLAVAAGGGLALYMVAILWAVAGFVGMIVGIVVAVLLLRLLWRTMDPVAPAAFRNEGKQFIAAWEGRFGEMRPGLRATQPPPGSFQRWLADHRRTGVPAGDWIDAHMQRGAGLAIRAEDRLVRGHCRLGRTLLTDPEPPPMGLVADPTHLRLYNIDGPEFVRVTWSAIREVERTEEGWLLYFDLESKEPNDRFVATNFYAMTVSSVDDPQRFHGLLRDHGFRWQHTNIDLEGVQPDDDRGELVPSPPHSVDMRTETTVEASLIAARLAEVEHLLVQAESRARKEASDLRVLRDHLRDQLS